MGPFFVCCLVGRFSGVDGFSEFLTSADREWSDLEDVEAQNGCHLTKAR